MSNFLSEFNSFLNIIMSGMGSVWGWLSSTIIGKVMIFVVLITIFVWFIDMIINIGDKK